MKVNILAFDIAITTGWAYMQNGVIKKTGTFKYNNAIDFLNDIENILDTYKIDYVIAASPTRFFNTIFKHGRIFGLFDLALQKRDLKFWMDTTAKGKATLPIDSKMKKNVLGKGKAAKQEIMDFMNIPQEDEADAGMFATYLYNILNT